jgi:hypothetical protein
MQIDPRGPRFGAAITTVVLAVALVLGPTNGLVLVALQALVFACGAVLGLRFAPYGALYRRLLRPRLGPPSELEDERPPRFAQGVGLVFALVALFAGLVGLDPIFYAAVGMALAAAFLNAAFNFCLGCEMYLRLSKLQRTTARVNPSEDQVPVA